MEIKNLKVGSRLALGFGAVLLMLAIMSGLSIYSLASWPIIPTTSSPSAIRRCCRRS